MKRTVMIQTDTDVTLTLVDHYGQPYPADAPFGLTATPAGGTATVDLTPTDDYPQSVRYQISDAEGRVALFVLPDGTDGVAAALLGAFVGRHGWQWLDGLGTAWDFPTGLIHRIDSHMLGLAALRPYEERLYQDFDAYENGELIRPDLQALDDHFVTLSGGPL
jgi:hypothetical protein